MLATERRRIILRLLAANGALSVVDLVQRLGVSAPTVRRDATLLAKTGEVIRRHGGILPASFAKNEPHFRAKSTRQMGLKMRLARDAATLLPHDGTVFVDAGTTCLEVGRLLLERPNLRIYTNSIPLLALAPEARATLTGIGGEARKVSLALTGALTQAWLAHLRFDSAVIGASGLDLDGGAYTTELQEAAVKVEVLRRSEVRMLVADSEKWDHPCTLHFAPWSAFTLFVTNQSLPREARARLGAAGVKVRSI